MATIKVKLRNSVVRGKAGTIYYQVTHCRKTARITTDIHLQPEQWDKRFGQVAAHPKLRLFQHRIDNDLATLHRIVRHLSQHAAGYTAADIVRLYRTVAEREMTILRYLQLQIERLRSCNRLGTACNYERTLRSLSGYLHGNDLPLALLTESVVDGYNLFLLRRGIVRNSISFYMRVLRAVFNKAVRARLTDQTDPFRNVYTGIDRTRKRAVDERVIIRLSALDLPPRGDLTFTRDLFLFSYCTRGMAFVDMAYLRKSDLSDGMIHYSRHKTGKQLSVKVEPFIRKIIDRYAVSSESGYLFPILSTNDPHSAFHQYQKALNRYNRLLKQLSEMLRLDRPLSSYTARHSWATAARNHNIPVSVISSGMGHSSERTTQIYLTLLENSVIDAANRQIISVLQTSQPLHGQIRRPHEEGEPVAS